MMKTKVPILMALGLVVLLVAAVGFMTQGNLLAEQPAGGQAAPVQSVARQDDQPIPPGPGLVDTTQVTLSLASGFVMDPYVLRVVGQGDTDASTLNEECTGFVNKTPNVVLDWSGKGESLSIFTYSDSDPILVIETPAGEFICNDDQDLDTLDAVITLNSPDEGTYNIHVGSYSKSEPALGWLGITELAPMVAKLDGMDLGTLLSRNTRPVSPITERPMLDRLRLAEDGAFGNATLETGFDTIRVPAVGGGDLPAAIVDGQANECSGFISVVPTFSIDWSGSGSFRVMFAGLADTEIGVISPDGEVFCNAGVSTNNLNPAVSVTSAVEGNYDIFVASAAPERVVPGLLTVTADLTAEPIVLEPAE